MGFCRIWDEQVLQAETPEEKQEAAALTIDLCLQRGYLVRYLEDHRSEVERMMMTMLSPEYVKMASERTRKIKEDIRPCLKNRSGLLYYLNKITIAASKTKAM